MSEEGNVVEGEDEVNVVTVDDVVECDVEEVL